MGTIKVIRVNGLRALLWGATLLLSAFVAATASASNQPAQVSILLDRAQKLETAAAVCRQKVANGEMTDCTVEVTFQNRRLISPDAAEFLAATLRRQAKTIEVASSQIAQLQDQFQSLKQQIDLDRQVLQNFGFEKTVEEIEYWGNLPARQIEDAKNAFKTMLFDAALSSVSKAASAVGSLTPEEVDALNRLADVQGAPPLGFVAGANDVHKALEFLDKTKGAYEAADAIRKRQLLEAAVKLGGLASKNPAFSLLLTADGWAAYQVYQSTTAVKSVQNLTKVNEGDLILLKSRSEKLKNEVNQLTSVKKQLAKLSSEYDSTTLVTKPK